MKRSALLSALIIAIILPFCLFSDENYDKDIKNAEAAVAAQPKSADARYSLAMVNYEQGKYLSTFGKREEKNKCLEASILDFGKALELYPKFLDALHYRGWAYYRIGKNKEALTDFYKIIKIDPNYELAYNGLGVVFESQGKHDEAIAAYSMNIKMFPVASHAWANRAGAYLAKKDYKNALADYDQSIKLDPSGGNGTASEGTNYTERAAVHLEMKEFDKAIADYNKAIDLNPKNPAFLISRGRAYESNYRYDEAREDFDAAIKIYPGNAEPYILKGNTYFDEGNKGFASMWYTKAVNADPGSAWAWNSKGRAEYSAKNHTQAKQSFEKAAELSLGWADPVTYQGYIAWYANKPEEAINLLNRSISIDPTSFAYAGRGAVYQSQEKLDEAIRDFRKALELDPDYDWAKSNLQAVLSKKNGKQPVAAKPAASAGDKKDSNDVDLGAPEPGAEIIKK